MRTLFITVGTRQVGWRCRDGTVCSFGADGDRNEYPRHIDKLYRELGVLRGRHQNQPWGVQDLGQRYYRHCLEVLRERFDPVELLLDQQVIEQQYSQGLTQVVLWGTHQPETTAWVYRNKDTHWLAQLMAGKIRQAWPALAVEVFAPVVDASDQPGIRRALDGFFVAHTQPFLTATAEADFTLLIQTKGAVPAIAQSLEICAAGLVRQYPVFSVVPVEPVPLFAPESQSAQLSCRHQVMAIGEYFWPIERLRIVSAWQRGDFAEAALWLTAHQSRYRALYRLARCLTLATNWQMQAFFLGKTAGIGPWLAQGAGVKAVAAEQLEVWRAALLTIRSSVPAQTWESRFLIYLLLVQGNYTDAFLRFAQTLERLLYLRSQAEGWFSQGELRGNHPGFKQLIDRWFGQQVGVGEPLYRQFDRIRNMRNQVVHRADAMTLAQVYDLWPHPAPSAMPPQVADVYAPMAQTLRQVCAPDWPLSEEALLRSLYQWGLDQLMAQ